MNVDVQQTPPEQKILHLCRREVLRPIRDEILRVSGYQVDSTISFGEGLDLFRERLYVLVLVDVDGEDGIHLAETFCGDVRTLHPGQLVAFVCNWRVATLTDCPDEVLRTEFDPGAFVAGVKKMLSA
jgi:hypothetical protein